MSLVTRCPRCKTLFHVTPAQLQVRSGQVRCGRCMQAFDGFQALANRRAPAGGEPAEPQPSRAAGTASAVAPSAASVSGVQHDAPAGTGISEPAEHGTRAGPWVAPSSAEREGLSRKLTRESRTLAACIALALLLAVQLAYAFRSELAARYPSVRTALSGVCSVVGCSVSLPQRPDLVKIEASDVHKIDNNRPSRIQLTATLRSYASYDLGYPALDLVLTNENEHALVRRIFVADEYLDYTRDPKAGIPPRAEITVALDLDTGDLRPAGFRLDLLPGPAP